VRKKNVLDMGLSGAASVLADSSEMRAAGKGYEPMPTFFSKQISTLAARSKSLAVKPPASCVTRARRTRL